MAKNGNKVKRRECGNAQKCLFYRVKANVAQLVEQRFRKGRFAISCHSAFSLGKADTSTPVERFCVLVLSSLSRRISPHFACLVGSDGNKWQWIWPD
jgi:hypothetical protein